MISPIVFYDITSNLPTQAWSPNTWKTRYTLNYKGIPYKTVWLEYAEIEPRSKEVGAGPTRKKYDGTPNYNPPHDPRPQHRYTLFILLFVKFPVYRVAGAVIADSPKIAAYLDAMYPDTPRLIPSGAAGLLRAFEETMRPLLADTLYRYTVPATISILNPPSAAYFRRKWETLLSKPMEDITPRGEDDIIEWQRVKDVFGKVDEWILANGEDSAYIMGDILCWAEIYMVGYLHWAAMVVPENWEEMKLWHGGRWATLLRNFEKYETVV
ncbi:hypothetical protein C8R43DRAFT_961716 [Mycena crocata]|nr:hypothetical protein C8R43DRAFT_961716 [Mycena crocata]